MAPVSLSRHVWDPYRVLDVDPNDSNSTCVGLAKTTGYRCRWHFDSEQFNASQRDNAVNRLESMSERHPSEVTQAELYSLARNTLCRDFHQYQADAKSTEWKAKIEDYLRRHIESQTVAGPTTQLHNGFDGAKKLPNGIAKDRDASEQEVKATRETLEQMTAKINESQTLCSELMQVNKKLDKQREDDRAANSRDVAQLWRELTDFQTKAKVLVEHDIREREILKRRLEGMSANLENDIASSKAIQGLRDSKSRLEKATTASILETGNLKAEVRNVTKKLDEKAATNEEEADSLREQFRDGSQEVQRLRQELEVLNRKFTESQDENTARQFRLQEQERKVERLEQQMAKVKEDEMRRDENVEQLTEQMNKVKEDLTRRDANVEQLTAQMNKLKEDLMKRDANAEQLAEQTEKLKEDLTKRDGSFKQLAEQMKGVQQDLTKRNENVKLLAGQTKEAKQESTRRNQDVKQLAQQMKEVKQDLAKRDERVEHLTKQMDAVKRELAEREDKLSSLRAQNAKGGFFAAVSRQRPKMLVKISKIMRTDSVYVQSAT